MKYLAAYLLANLSGSAPDAAAVKKILASVGAEVESDRVDAVVAALEGKDIATVIAEGSSKLASVPAGGAVAAAPSAAAAGGAAAGGAAKEEKKKEEAAEESDDDMGFGLFD